MSKRKLTVYHGLSRTNEYKIYNAMRQRCNNKNNPNYFRYGGRGVKVCRRWSGTNGFVNFYNDMGKRPSLQHSIDRINVYGGYSPDNCRWATWEIQASNKRAVEMVLCTYEDCIKKHKAMGLCNMHYLKQRRGWLGIKRYKATCRMNGCNNIVYAKGLCNPHYQTARLMLTRNISRPI